MNKEIPVYDLPPGLTETSFPIYPAGISLVLRNEPFLQVYAGNALNEYSTDFVFGLGFSARIPGK